MHAGTVDILINKAHVEPDVAFAEAIDVALSNAQLVTVPVLDTRFASLDSRITALEAKMDVRFRESEAHVDARIEKCKADLIKWVFLVMLGNVALSAGATAVLNMVQRAAH
jgi:hypothetical protein